MRRVARYALTLMLAAGTVTAAGAASPPPAAALTAPVAMTADDLPTWQTNGIVWDLAEANGVVYAGGTFSAVRPPGAEPGTEERPARNFIALDAATGEPIEDCDLSFTVGSGVETVRALEVSADQKTLYVGGRFGSVNGVGVSSVAAIDLATCTPQHFPAAANATVRGLAVTEDRVYLAGDFTQLNGQARRYFGAVNTDGSLRDWVADGDEVGRAVAVTPEGENVVLGGEFFTVNGADSHALAVVDADDASPVRLYPLGFIEQLSVVMDLYTDESGIYTGNEGRGGQVFDGRIALDHGTFDERWRDTCLGATQAVTVYQDVLYSGHHAHDCASMGSFPNQERYHLFAQSVDDPTLLGWFPNTNDGLGASEGPRDIVVSEDHPDDDRDFMWVGGEFTAVNGQPQWSLTRFASSPDTGAPVAPEAHAASTAPGEIQVSWRSGVDLDDSVLTYRVYRDGGSTPVHTVEGSSFPWQRPQLSFTDTGIAEGETHSYRVSATDAVGNTSALSPSVSATESPGRQSYADEVLADDPLLYWRYDESGGNYAADASGNDSSGVHRGTPQRGVTPPAVSGEAAAAVGHNGVTSYTYSDTGYPSTDRLTVETWFRSETTTGGRLIGFGNRIWQTSTTRDRHIFMTDGGQLVFGVYPNAYREIKTSGSYNDGAWHHAAATLGADGMRLYVDGELAASSSTTTTAQDYGDRLGYWRAGGDTMAANWPSRPSETFFDGELDETAVYGHALSAGRIAAHHEAASVPADTTTRLAPVQDTHVNQFASGTVHGSHQQLAVRGSPEYESYLRFEAPPAPSGTVLKAATLRITLTGEQTPGASDDRRVVPVTGDWDEATTTYTNRPQWSAQELGTLSGAVTPGAAYTMALDPAWLAGRLGQDVDVGLVGEGESVLRFWSREAAAVNRPQLALTFGAP